MQVEIQSRTYIMVFKNCDDGTTRISVKILSRLKMFYLICFLEQLYSETQLGIKSGMDFDLHMWFDYEALQIC